jgi:TRAP transporter TAXI family solute receptor
VKKNRILFFLAGILFLVAQCNGVRFISIGTGSVTGVYYPAGKAISKILNEKGSSDYRFFSDASGGSLENLRGLLEGRYHFGIIQSDRQYLAYTGQKEWEGKGPQRTLRSVLSIYPELITVVAAQESGIRTLADIRGKKVNLGNEGSGQLENAREILEILRIGEKDFKPLYMEAVKSPQILQERKVDAFFYTVGHPNENIREATQGKIQTRFVGFPDELIRQAVQKYPYYAPSFIPVHYYPKAANKNPVKTLGVQATLTTTAAMDDKVVYVLTKKLFENLEEFKKQHPAFSHISIESMFQGLTAPIHPGALKYYKESGLTEYIAKNLIE